MTVTFLPLTLPAARAGVPRLLEWMRELYSSDGLGYHEDRARHGIDGLVADPAYGGIWIINAGDVAVGYLILTIGYSLEFHGRYGLLDEFFVESDWRGRGVGRQALAFAADWCRSKGLHALRLEVGRRNLRALGLYQRAGFELHDRHLMTKWL